MESEENKSKNRLKESRSLANEIHSETDEHEETRKLLPMESEGNKWKKNTTKELGSLTRENMDTEAIEEGLKEKARHKSLESSSLFEKSFRDVVLEKKKICSEKKTFEKQSVNTSQSSAGKHLLAHNPISKALTLYKSYSSKKEEEETKFNLRKNKYKEASMELQGKDLDNQKLHLHGRAKKKKEKNEFGAEILLMRPKDEVLDWSCIDTGSVSGKSLLPSHQKKVKFEPAKSKPEPKTVSVTLAVQKSEQSEPEPKTESFKTAEPLLHFDPVPITKEEIVRVVLKYNQLEGKQRDLLCELAEIDGTSTDLKELHLSMMKGIVDKKVKEFMNACKQEENLERIVREVTDLIRLVEQKNHDIQKNLEKAEKKKKKKQTKK